MNSVHPIFAEPLSITIENFGGIERLTWKPHGVCVLVGPNGSGKSTILDAFALMAELARGASFGQVMGNRGSALRDGGKHGAARITLALERLEWTVGFAADNESERDGIGLVSESCLSKSNVIDTIASHWHYNWPVSARSMIVGAQSHIETMRVRAACIHGHLARGRGAPILRDVEHAAHVLEDGEEQRWIGRVLSSMFPGAFEVINVYPSGSIVSADVSGKAAGYPPRPLRLMSSGFVSAFDMLTTIAMASAGATILFDQPEDGLHPHALARLVEAIRSRSEEKDLTVVFATHSPVLLDAFNDAPEDVWVADTQKGVTRLTDELEPDWLATYHLGSIYGSAYGRQAPKRESCSTESDQTSTRR